MDFSAWSPSHTVLVAIMVLGFVGQLIRMLPDTIPLPKMVTRSGRKRQSVEKMTDCLKRRRASGKPTCPKK